MVKAEAIVAALAKHPVLEFEVWSLLRKVHYYGEWMRESHADGSERWSVSDEDGGAVATLSMREKGEWALSLRSNHDGTKTLMGTCSEAMTLTEAHLRTQGWRRAPFRLGDWVRGEGDVLGTHVERRTFDGDAIAVCGLTPQGFGWGTYEPAQVGTLRAKGVAPSLFHAKYQADQDLVAWGRLSPERAEPYPADIPF